MTWLYNSKLFFELVNAELTLNCHLLLICGDNGK